MTRPLSEKKIHRIGRIDQIVRDHFAANPAVSEVAAKDLMKIFIQKGIFLKDHKDGFPIRYLLRELDSQNKLHLLNHVRVTRHDKNRGWSFSRKAD